MKGTYSTIVKKTCPTCKNRRLVTWGTVTYHSKTDIKPDQRQVYKCKRCGTRTQYPIEQEAK